MKIAITDTRGFNRDAIFKFDGQKPHIVSQIIQQHIADGNAQMALCVIVNALGDGSTMWAELGRQSTVRLDKIQTTRNPHAGVPIKGKAKTLEEACAKILLDMITPLDGDEGVTPLLVWRRGLFGRRAKVLAVQ